MKNDAGIDKSISGRLDIEMGRKTDGVVKWMNGTMLWNRFQNVMKKYDGNGCINGWLKWIREKNDENMEIGLTFGLRNG